MFCVYYAFLFVHCSLVVTCSEMAKLLALSYMIFFVFFVTFPCVVMGQVWYLIVSIPDLCLRTYFNILCVISTFGLSNALTNFHCIRGF